MMGSQDNNSATAHHAAADARKKINTRAGPRSRSSPFIGVSQYKRTGKWECHIWDKQAGKQSCGKQIHIGTFESALQAARMYDRMSLVLREDGAELNFPQEDYTNDAVLAVLKTMTTRQQVLQHLRRLSADDDPLVPEDHKEIPLSVFFDGGDWRTAARAATSSPPRGAGVIDSKAAVPVSQHGCGEVSDLLVRLRVPPFAPECKPYVADMTPQYADVAALDASPFDVSDDVCAPLRNGFNASLSPPLEDGLIRGMSMGSTKRVREGDSDASGGSAAKRSLSTRLTADLSQFSIGTSQHSMHSGSGGAAFTQTIKSEHAVASTACMVGAMAQHGGAAHRNKMFDGLRGTEWQAAGAGRRGSTAHQRAFFDSAEDWRSDTAWQHEKQSVMEASKNIPEHLRRAASYPPALTWANGGCDGCEPGCDGCDGGPTRTGEWDAAQHGMDDVDFECGYDVDIAAAADVAAGTSSFSQRSYSTRIPYLPPYTPYRSILQRPYWSARERVRNNRMVPTRRLDVPDGSMWQHSRDAAAGYDATPAQHTQRALWNRYGGRRHTMAPLQPLSRIHGGTGNMAQQWRLRSQHGSMLDDMRYAGMDDLGHGGSDGTDGSSGGTAPQRSSPSSKLDAHALSAPHALQHNAVAQHSTTRFSTLTNSGISRSVSPHFRGHMYSARAHSVARRHHLTGVAAAAPTAWRLPAAAGVGGEVPWGVDAPFAQEDPSVAQFFDSITDLAVDAAVEQLDDVIGDDDVTALRHQQVGDVSDHARVCAASAAMLQQVAVNSQAPTAGCSNAIDAAVAPPVAPPTSPFYAANVPALQPQHGSNAAQHGITTAQHGSTTAQHGTANNAQQDNADERSEDGFDIEVEQYCTTAASASQPPAADGCDMLQLPLSDSCADLLAMFGDVSDDVMMPTSSGCAAL